MHSVGERIRKRRKELGWTQAELAQKAGISKSFLSDVENGKKSISARNLLDVSRAIGVSLDYLMKGEADAETTEYKEQIEIPRELASFATEEGISMRRALTLLDMRRQIIANRRRGQKKEKEFDWKGFYEAVKEFLND